MLTGRGQRECEGPSPVQGYLVESVTSATSIIAIFDLFCRTFTMNYCVLSLAYCVYIASSIFLLQVQAAPDDQQAMRKLTYCIQCLQQVSQISPGKDNWRLKTFPMIESLSYPTDTASQLQSSLPH
jgi:hypothetical protein